MEGAGAIVLRGPAQPAPPLAAQDRRQVRAPLAGEQLDVVLADARDVHGIAAREGDGRATHLAQERGAVARLARQPPRRRSRGVPGVAEMDDGLAGALLD